MASASFGNSYGAKSKTIEVPLQHEQVLEVVCDDLPTNPTELTDIFLQESVGLPYYRMLAIEYYEQDKIEQSITVVQAGLTMASQSPHTQPRQKLPLLTLIATLYMRLAKKEPVEKERTKYLEDATQFINEADRIHNQYEPTFVVKGNLYILWRKIDEAARSFNMVLEKRPNCIPALLGKAKIQYHLKKYKQSLETYQTALKFSRGKYSGVEIRLGIAQCFFQLKMYVQAKAALKRCIEVSPIPNSTALFMLAIIELNESKSTDEGIVQQETSLKHGLQHLQQAHVANKKNPVVLNMMANHFFLTRDFEKTMAAASRALDSASNNVTKAEASYQIARAHHQMQEFDNAYKFYSQALELNPEHILAQFGMGQMKLKRDEKSAAIEIFEKLLKLEPNCVEIMKVLGSLYGLVDKKQESLQIFSKLLENTNDDPLLSMEIAEMYEEKDSANSLKFYEQSLGLLDHLPSDDVVTQERIKEIKPELLNNIAVMHQKLNNLNEAEKYYGLAIQECEASEGPEKDFKLTVLYNLARLYEEKLDIEKSLHIYGKIAEDYPSYPDARLRIGEIKQLQGKIVEAMASYKAVIDIEPVHTNAWIMMSRAQALESEKISKRSFERVLKECNKNDIYTHVALGNYHAATARELKGEKAQKFRNEAYKLAVNFYSQALRRDPHNVYAANGLAITIAENGHLEQARDLFNQVREAAVNNSNVWVNLAHIYVELKQYKKAIVMYENALKKFFNNKDANISLCLARAQYILGKSEKDPDMMREALKHTQRALLIDPFDKTTLYNLALVQQSYAQQISDRTQEQRTSEDIKRALHYLECGQRSFHMLIQVEEHTLYDKKITEQRERYGETLRGQLDRKLADQIHYEQERETKLRLARQKREEEQAKIKREQEEKAREEKRKLDRTEEERRIFMQKVREDNMSMASRQMDEDDVDEEKKSKKRTRKRKEREEEVEEEVDGDEEPSHKKDRKQYKSKRIIEDSDDEDL